MPKNPNIEKVLVIGSGPIVIGQAAEFDYAGAQACRVLRQEGIKTVLVNSNPATIMTDKHLADAIYLEPLTAQTLTRIIALERPDGLLAGLGGQTGLTLAMQLTRDGTLEKYGVKLLGSGIDAIERAEDRERFRETLAEMGQPVIPSATCEDVDTALKIASEIVSRHRAPGLHARRHGRRHRGGCERACRHRTARSGPLADYAGADRKMRLRLERDRV